MAENPPRRDLILDKAREVAARLPELDDATCRRIAKLLRPGSDAIESSAGRGRPTTNQQPAPTTGRKATA